MDSTIQKIRNLELQIQGLKHDRRKTEQQNAELQAEVAMLERHIKMLLELVVDYTNGKARIEDAINVLHAVLTEEE